MKRGRGEGEMWEGEERKRGRGEGDVGGRREERKGGGERRRCGSVICGKGDMNFI